MVSKVIVCHLVGGDDGIRTHDPLLAGQVLSQLSYTPIESDSKQHLDFVYMSSTCPLESFVLGKILLFLHFLLLTFGDLSPKVNVSVGLFSRTVSRKVFSPLQSLTSVFGMGTGGPSAFVTLTSFQ